MDTIPYIPTGEYPYLSDWSSRGYIGRRNYESKSNPSNILY